MKRLLLATLLAYLPCAGADALHPLFRDGLWRHEFSGWLFPARLGTLARAGQPYSIDGNDDAAGAIYGTAPGPLLVVDVFGRQSTDPRAQLAGARAAVAASRPELAAGAEQPFALPGTSLAGRRVDHAGAGGTPLWLYFIEGPDWVVSILATGHTDAAAADALVRTLPWASLGSPERLH